MDLMTYKLHTIRNLSMQDKSQWSERSLADELDVCQHRTLAKLFERYLPRKGQIVEAGCGLGGWVKFLEMRGYSILGIDRDRSVVKRAKDADPKMPIEVGNIIKTRFADDSFSAYISLGVIEHFENGPQVPLSEAFRILSPGGVALITVPANCLARKLIVHPLRSVVLWLLKVKGNEIYFGEYRYNSREIRAYIEKVGFKIIGFDWDEIEATDTTRHIGIYADFPFMRASHGTWRLNTIGRIYRYIAQWISPKFHVNGYFFIAQKPK
jgi:SAM-dependent methyltransferase